MSDHVLFGHIYIPGFMVWVILSLIALFAVKSLLGGFLRKHNFVNPSLIELCLVVIATGQLLILQVQ
ncbi:DUF1656 domain-containing protein [Vibrio superstes]|uniref:DUF1656 domain-containing protein n=1 Tax=Vibrio superstes NBRC 103154 TaxID=1219062 RepID=A0A511QKE9_9VIBR|nr:DUF1656 domain-containing protein [Vibrio superstes]GEM77761.1 hypothetical protein VSU01S_00060 [Vibrio superstes NBRC 103154]